MSLSVGKFVVIAVIISDLGPNLLSPVWLEMNQRVMVTSRRKMVHPPVRRRDEQRVQGHEKCNTMLVYMEERKREYLEMTNILENSMKSRENITY